MNFQIMTYQIK